MLQDHNQVVVALREAVVKVVVYYKKIQVWILSKVRDIRSQE